MMDIERIGFWSKEESPKNPSVGKIIVLHHNIDCKYLAYVS